MYTPSYSHQNNITKPPPTITATIAITCDAFNPFAALVRSAPTVGDGDAAGTTVVSAATGAMGVCEGEGDGAAVEDVSYFMLKL